VSDWSRSTGFRYGGAVLAVALAAALRFALDPLLDDSAPHAAFFVAVLIAAWYGGIGPALTAIAASILAANYLFIDPRHSLLIDEFDQRISVGFFAAVSLTASALAVGRHRQTQRTVAETQRERESLQTTFRSIGDAVVVTDAQGRVTYLNPVAERLTGWSLEEATGVPLDAVFCIVNEQSRQPVENPVEKVLRLGGIVGLANHTILIARDGTEWPIDDSAAPIRDDRDTLCGVVLVFRDITERRRAEEARRHLAAIVESSEDAVIGKTLDGVITSWNAAAQRLYGYSPQEAVGQPISLIVPPEREEELSAILQRLRRGERIEHHETIRRCKDGRRVPISVTISPIRDGADRIVGASAIARDISERLRAEEALREGEEQLRIVTASVPVALCRCDREGRYRFVNQAYADRFGMQPKEFVGRRYQDVLSAEVSESIEPHVKAVLEGRRIEFEVAAPDRRLGERIVHAAYVPDRNVSGDVDGWIAVISDVTERRQVENALRESERRFARFMQHLPGLAWIKDREGRYVYANHAAEEAFCTPLAELCGKTDAELFPPETAAQFQQNDRRVLEEGGSIQTIETLEHDDGIVHHSLVSKFPIPGREGAPVLIGGMAIDITERKQAQEALRESEARSTAILQTSLDAIITIDAGGRVLEFNPAAEEMFGYARGEAVGRSLAELIIPPSLRAQHQRGLARCLETGAGPVLNERIEMPALRADGTEFPVELAIARIPSDGPPCFTGFIRDITARKRTEDSLRFLARASATLGSLVDFGSTLQKIAQLAVPDFADWCVVDIADADGALQRLAVAHKDPAKALLGEQFRDRYPPDLHSGRGAAHVLATGRPEWQADISEELLEATARDAEHLRVLRELGLTSYMCMPIVARGRALGVITFVAAESRRRYTEADLAVAEDLAHRAGTAIENARLYQQVREADHRKDEFLAMLAHELRNPLAPIRSGLDILAMQPHGDHETLELMQQQVEHLVRLVDDLLDVSRIVRGKIELRREPLQLAPIVRRSVEAVRQIVEAAARTCRCCCPPSRSGSTPTPSAWSRLWKTC
jgi:PAS domain S-box-containing protein